MRRVRRLVPDDVWREIEPVLPPPQPTPKGGRPRSDDRAALAGIVHVLRTGTSWATLPQDLGFGSGMTCWRRLREWQSAGVWPFVEAALLKALPDAERLPWQRVEAGARSGQRTLESAAPERALRVAGRTEAAPRPAEGA